jgi:hypothetical protein
MSIYPSSKNASSILDRLAFRLAIKKSLAMPIFSPPRA